MPLATLAYHSGCLVVKNVNNEIRDNTLNNIKPFQYASWRLEIVTEYVQKSGSTKAVKLFDEAKIRKKTNCQG